MFPQPLIDQYDPQGILSVLSSFPSQVESALETWTTIERRPASIVMAGMGGSALGGQLLVDLLSDKLTVPLAVHRNYGLPAFVDESSLVFAVSYSGNTEETVSAFESAVKAGAEVVAVSAGGKLQALAEAHGTPHIAVPPGFQPRLAWAHTCLPILNSLNKAKLTEQSTEGLPEVVNDLSFRYLPDQDSEPIGLANSLQGLIPVYATSSSTSTLAYKWKINTNENAKQQAFASVFPELNHNEMIGWRHPRQVMDKCALVLLRTDYESDRVAERIELTKQLIGDTPGAVLEFKAPGRTKIEQMFGSIYAGDFMSYYLALLNQEDPEPVAVVEELKARLAH